MVEKEENLSWKKTIRNARSLIICKWHLLGGLRVGGGDPRKNIIDSVSSSEKKEDIKCL